MARCSAFLALVSVSLLGLPQAAAAEDKFFNARGDPQITARGSTLVYVTNTPKGERLRKGFGTAARNLPLRHSPRFDGAALGTDSKRRGVLVYARCGKRCDLFLYRAGRERRLSSISRRACSEGQPHIVRGAVVFVRRVRRSSRRSRRCAGGIFLKRPGKRLRRISRSTPSQLDWDGRRIAYARVVFNSRDPNPEGEPHRSQIRVLRPGGHSRALASAMATVTRGRDNTGKFLPDPVFTGTVLADPALSAGRVYWTRSVVNADEGTEVNDVVRRRADGSAPEQVLERFGSLWVEAEEPSPQLVGVPSDDPLGPIAVTGNRLYYVSSITIGRVSGTPVFH